MRRQLRLAHDQFTYHALIYKRWKRFSDVSYEECHHYIFAKNVDGQAGGRGPSSVVRLRQIYVEVGKLVCHFIVVNRLLPIELIAQLQLKNQRGECETL